MRLETNRIPPSLEAYLPKEKMNYIPLSLGGGGGQYIDVVNQVEITSAEDYSQRLQEGYEWVQIMCHANHSARRHAFREEGGPKGSGGNFTSEDLFEKGHESLFQNVFTCGSADYTKEDYLCGWYALTEEHGLGNVGSTKPGSMLEFDNYYEPLSEGKTLGEAMQEWWKETVEDEPIWVSWYYGMTTIGDPTLTVREEPEQHTFSLDIEGEGSVKIEGDVVEVPYVEEYDESETLTLKAEAEQGVRFVEWYDELEGETYDTDRELEVVVEEDISLVARFEEVDVEYEINDWEDLYNVRYDLEGNYTLMNNLDENTEGYDEFASSEANQREKFVERLEVPQHSEEIKLSHAPVEEILIARDTITDEELESEIIDEGEGIIELLESHSEHIKIEYTTSEKIPLGWEPLGASPWVEDMPFSGIFDGQGHTIEGLYIDRPHTRSVRLFGHVVGGDVNDVDLVDVDIRGEQYVGGLVGGYIDGTVSDSYVSGTVRGTSNIGGLIGATSGERKERKISNSSAEVNVNGEINIGGLVGEHRGTLVDSHASGDVSGDSRVGGLVGYNWRATVETSHSAGSVTGNLTVGGLIGDTREGTVSNTYATGEVEGENSVGGLVGFKSRSTLQNSYAAGEVTGEESVGGLVGRNQGDVKNSYYISEVDGTDDVGALVGVNSLANVGNVNDSFALEGAADELIGERGNGEKSGRVSFAPEYDLKNIDLYQDDEFKDYDPLNEEWDIEKVESDEDNYPYHSSEDSVWKIEQETYHTLNLTIEGEGEIDLDEDQYLYGTELNATAESEEGWSLVEWKGDYEGTEEEITITMDEDKEITAYFEKSPYFEVKITDYVEEIEEGDEVTVEYEIENTGDLESAQNIELLVDGTEEVDEEITIESGDTYEGEFTLEVDEQGEYDLEVASEDDLDSVTVTVEEDDDIPGFTLVLSALALITSIIIYGKKRD